MFRLLYRNLLPEELGQGLKFYQDILPQIGLNFEIEQKIIR